MILLIPCNFIKITYYFWNLRYLSYQKSCFWEKEFSYDFKTWKDIISHIFTQKKISLIKKKCLWIKQICALPYGQQKVSLIQRNFLIVFFFFELKKIFLWVTLRLYYATTQTFISLIHRKRKTIKKYLWIKEIYICSKGLFQFELKKLS